MGGCPPTNHENRLSLRGARPRSKLGVMRVRLLPLRFAQGRNDTWGIYFRNKSEAESGRLTGGEDSRVLARRSWEAGMKAETKLNSLII